MSCKTVKKTKANGANSAWLSSKKTIYLANVYRIKQFLPEGLFTIKRVDVEDRIVWKNERVARFDANPLSWNKSPHLRRQ